MYLFKYVFNLSRGGKESFFLGWQRVVSGYAWVFLGYNKNTNVPCFFLRYGTNRVGEGICQPK